MRNRTEDLFTTKIGVDFHLLFSSLIVSLGAPYISRHDRSGMSKIPPAPVPDQIENEMEELTRYLASVRLHDRKAFRQLYKMTSGTLYGIALRILDQESLAQEVLQEAYIRIWNSASSYQPDLASPKTWMATIVRNLALDHLRKNKNEVKQTDPFELTKEIDSDLLPAEKMAQSEDGKKLSDCLNGLKQEQRQIIALAYYKGLTHGELSNYTGHPLGTVKTNIRRGLEHLRRCLGS